MLDEKQVRPRNTTNISQTIHLHSHLFSWHFDEYY